MARTCLVRQIAPLLFAAWPALAFALNVAYEGLLKPDGAEPPVPIVVELRDSGGTLKGSVKTSSPLQGSAPIESGSNVFGHCTADVVLSKTITLRLDGACDKSAFSGTYVLKDTQKRAVTTGDFHLAHKAPEAGKRGSTMAASGVGACLKANTQCLVLCSRPDGTIDFLCSNRCRTRLRICKEQATGAPLPDTE